MRIDMKFEKGRIPELDGLRGLAIAGVLLFHLGLKLRLPASVAAIARFGWSGVDLFFVLSGFLIGGILIDHRDSEAYFKPFYARRFFRIIPLYLAILGFYGLFWASHARITVSEYLLPPMSWWAYLSFTNNFWIAFNNNMSVFLAPSWSLAIEEQFYLTLPILVRYLRPNRLLPVLSAACAGILALRCYAVFHLGLPYNQVYTLPYFRQDALLLGVICAILVRNVRVRELLTRNWWAMVAIIAALGAAIYKAGYSLLPERTDALLGYGLTEVALLYSCILLLAVLHTPKFAILRIRPLAELGKVSYCLYLIHMVIYEVGARMLLRYVERWTVPEAWFIIAVVIFAMFLIAQLSWELFESPMLRIGHRFTFERYPIETEQLQPAVTRATATTAQ